MELLWAPGIQPGSNHHNEVRMGPPLKPVKVPLDLPPSLQRVDCTTQLGVISKLAESALSPTSPTCPLIIVSELSRACPQRET